MQAKPSLITADQLVTFRAAQVRSLYKGFVFPLVANILVSLVFVRVLWNAVPSSAILYWLSLQGISILARLVLVVSYNRKTRDNDIPWLNLFRASLGFSGLSWGLAAFLLFPVGDFSRQAILMLALAGMAAGSITAMSVDFVSVLLFSFPVMAALSARLFIEGGEIAFNMGLMSTLFFIFTTIIARRTSFGFRENMLLRFTRKLNEISLFHTEDSLNQAQRIAHLGNFDWNPVTGELQWSDEHYRLWGMEPRSIQPSYEVFRKAIHPGDVARVEAVLQEALQGKGAYECVHRVVWPDGSEHNIQGRGKVEFDESGTALRMVGTVQDITERNLTEEALRRSETKFRSLYDSTGDAVILLNEEGFIDCNRAALQTFGMRTQEEFCQKRPADISPLVQGDSRDFPYLPDRWFTEAMHNGSRRFEGVLRRIDIGVEFPAEILLNPMSLDEKAVVQVVVRDITERKGMELLLKKREREFRSLAESSPDNIIRYNLQCRAVYVNRALGETMGTSSDMFIGKTPMEAGRGAGVVGIENYQEKLQMVLSTGSAEEVEIILASSSGELRTHHVLFVPESGEDGEIVGALAFGRDISELKQQEALEETRLGVFEKLAKNASLPEILDLVVSYAEKFHPNYLVGILLLSEDGKSLRYISAPSLPEEYIEVVNGIEVGDGIGSSGTAVYRGQTVITEDIRNHPYWEKYKEQALRFGLVSCWSDPIFNSIGKVLGTFAVYRREPGRPNEADVKLMREAGYLAAVAIERKEAEETIHNLAFFDHLTKLPNRRLLYDRLQHTLATSARNLRHGAVIFIDLDKFKELNDTKGHDIGDLLLKETAMRLQACVREDDTVARLGGDEFVIVLNDLSPEMDQAALQAEVIAEKMRNALNQTFMLKSYEYNGSPSIGICMFLGNEATADELLKRADTAMYQAKRSGRNTSRFFDPATHAAMESRILFENDLRQALAKNEFRVYYQMQVDHESQVIGVEALLRWHHPVRGLIPPAQFISIAEETGLIVDMGYWVLDTACRQLKTWESDPRTSHLELAVNISAHQFRQTDFVEVIRHVIEESGISPGKLKLELTESLLLGNVAEIIHRMNLLKELGVHFSMDDFGTGYSSLSYLSQLPLDQLKIDKSFVQKMLVNPADAVIVQTIIGLGKILLLDVIAEGVETIEERDFLERNGCKTYQGYLFGIPIPVQELEKILFN